MIPLFLPFLSAQAIQTLILLQGKDFSNRAFSNFFIGASYNLMSYSALLFIFVWVAPFRLGKILLTLLGSSLLIFHYLDYEYFLQFGTHLPFSTIEYLKEPQHFSSSLSYSISRPSFFLLLLLPMLGVIASSWRSTRSFSLKNLARYSGFFLIVSLSSGTYSNSYVAKNLENPLTIPGLNYFAWTQDREKEIEHPKPTQALQRIQAHLGVPTTQPRTPLIRTVSNGQNCRSKSSELKQICQPSGQPYNILIIVLESFRAAEIGSLGSKLQLTPNFDQWSQKGILFSNFYANGFQTRHGEVAIYCSLFPNYGAAIMKRYPQVQFHCLPSVLREAGYTTSWVHGSDSSFDNQFSFFQRNGFSKIVDSFDFPSDGEQLGWGYSDQLLFSEWLTFLNQQKEPFFSSSLTITNHHPFEVPPEYDLNLGDSDLHHYYNSMYYTDAQLGRFLEQAQQQPWYNRTLIFITADTSNYQDPQEPTSDFQEFVELRARIPLLIVGGPVTEPAVISDFASQVDLAPTIMNALQADWTSHWVGHSLLDSSHRVAYTNRPGAYWAVMSAEAQYFNESNVRDHFLGDPTVAKDYKQLGQDWIQVNQWLLQEDLFWPKSQ